MAEAVADASALVDLLLGNEVGTAVQRRISGHALHAPRTSTRRCCQLWDGYSEPGPLITTDRRLRLLPVADVVVA